MTVWMFYLKHKGFDTTSLYAYTDSKELAHKFVSQRSKKTIVMIKRNNFSKDEWKVLCMQRPSLRIIEGHLYTKGLFYGTKRRVAVICTAKEEKDAVIHADKIWEEFSKYLFDARAFQKEYLIALEKLLFMKFYCFYVIKRVQDADYFYEPYYSNFDNLEAFNYEEFRETFCEYDELRVFTRMFKDTFPDDKG